jgi:outer membrane protein, multidrug efflux system
VATIAETYYSLLALDRKLAITRDAARKWGENVRIMKALKRAGEKDEAAVAQAEANRLDAESSALSLEKQMHELENSFSTLVGIAPSDIKRGQLLELSFPEKWSVGVPVQLLSKRPDVRQAEWQLAEAFYATNKARSAFYPQITLSGSAGWTNSSGAGIVNPGKWLLTALGSLVQPLFDKGNNVANLKIAQAKQQEALVDFQQKLLDAELHHGIQYADCLSYRFEIRTATETERYAECGVEHDFAAHSPDYACRTGSIVQQA